MKYDYDYVNKVVTEKLNNIDINEVAKFLSTSDFAIEYRDYYLTEEFQNWLKTFEEGGENEGEEYCDCYQGRTYFEETDDMCLLIASGLLFPSGITQDEILDDEVLDDIYSEVRDDIWNKNIIPDALELTLTMNNEKKAA